MAKPIPFSRDEHHEEPEENTDTSTSQASSPNEDLRTYTNEEVSEIIRLALHKASNKEKDTVNHAEMLAIGEDFGLSPEDIDHAFIEVEKSQQTKDLEKQGRAYLQLHAATYAVVNLGLIVLNLLTGIDTVWFIYPLVIWGIVLAVQWAVNKFALDWIFDLTLELGSANAIGVGDPLCVEFTIPDLYGSMAEANGRAHIEESALTLEYETVDTVFGAFKSKAKEVSVPLKDITNVQLDRGLWQTKLRIRGRKLHCFADVPGSNAGEAILIISSQSRLAAEKFTRELAARVSREQ